MNKHRIVRVHNDLVDSLICRDADYFGESYQAIFEQFLDNLTDAEIRGAFQRMFHNKHDLG